MGGSRETRLDHQPLGHRLPATMPVTTCCSWATLPGPERRFPVRETVRDHANLGHCPLDYHACHRGWYRARVLYPAWCTLPSVLPCPPGYTTVHRLPAVRPDVVARVYRARGRTAWAQRAAWAWATPLPVTTLPRVVTVLRTFSSGYSRARRAEAGNDRVYTGCSEPYTGLDRIVAEEAGLL